MLASREIWVEASRTHTSWPVAIAASPSAPWPHGRKAPDAFTHRLTNQKSSGAGGGRSALRLIWKGDGDWSEEQGPGREDAFERREERSGVVEIKDERSGAGRIVQEGCCLVGKGAQANSANSLGRASRGNRLRRAVLATQGVPCGCIDRVRIRGHASSCTGGGSEGVFVFWTFSAGSDQARQLQQPVV